MSPEHAATPPPPAPRTGLSLGVLCAVSLSVQGTFKLGEDSRPPRQCPAFSKGKGGLAPKRGSGSKEGELGMERDHGSHPLPLSDQRFVPEDGFERPLFSTGAKSSVAAFTTIRCGRGNSFFPMETNSHSWAPAFAVSPPCEELARFNPLSPVSVSPSQVFPPELFQEVGVVWLIFAE